MKKIAGIIVFVFGLVLIGLNYTSNNNSSFNLLNNSVDTELIDQKDVETKESAFDVSKINLPSVFDLLSKLI
jgi:hypothetical protein